MAAEQTLSIIKPDGVEKNLIGEIYSRFEKAGLEIVAARMLQLDKEQAEAFYAVHRERPFFNDLVSYMCSGPVMVQALSGDNAIALNRELMGATNPADAAVGTIRADHAESVEENVVHGSDGPDTARDEIAFFFADGVCPRTR
ncbi:MAG: nucleoside-diphosphate kinase [Pseudomonadota bacterium]